ARKLQEEDQGTAEFGVTPFSDLSEDEFLSLYAPRFRMPSGWANQTARVPEGPLLRQTCDWRKRRAVTPVKNQGSCRSCWAFAAVGNVESLWFLRSGDRLVSLSVQELLDCGRCGNGCEGGYTWDAFLTVLSNRGLAREEDYPYKAQVRPGRCRAQKFRAAWIHDFLMLPRDEQYMARYVADNGPITVTINMALLQLYVGGVLHPTRSNCDPDLLNHSVLLVGFGFGDTSAPSLPPPPSLDGGYPHWILKNSWGPKWGEEGYFRLHRGNNACGIAKYPVTAVVKGQRSSVSCSP
uniref:Peptidase C1A papain C-terminal domain-containing protein n=1 Tax=Ornithorhynchus anatinus TaxID=9258 RepID=A0A6I8PDZ7_ORNAN